MFWSQQTQLQHLTCYVLYKFVFILFGWHTPSGTDPSKLVDFLRLQGQIQGKEGQEGQDSEEEGEEPWLKDIFHFWFLHWHIKVVADGGELFPGQDGPGASPEVKWGKTCYWGGL